MNDNTPRRTILDVFEDALHERREKLQELVEDLENEQAELVGMFAYLDEIRQMLK